MAFNQQKKFNLSKAQQEPRPKKKKKVNGKHEIRWAKFNPRKTVILIHINKSLIKSQTLVGINEITDIHTSYRYISLYLNQTSRLRVISSEDHGSDLCTPPKPQEQLMQWNQS